MDHHDTLQRTRNKTAHRIVINTVVLIYPMQAIIGCVVIAARSSIVTSSHTARHTRHNDKKIKKRAEPFFLYRKKNSPFLTPTWTSALIVIG